MKEKIYFIPGLMTDIRLWKRVLPFLENEYEIVHIPIPELLDFDKINEVLLGFFKEEKVNILGFSLGGYIASYFAIKYPNRVKKIFMVAATPSSTNENEITKRKEKLKDIENEEFGLTKEKALSLVEEKNKKDEDLIQTMIDMFNDLGKEKFISQLNLTFYRIDLFDDLIKQDFPIWIFYSLNDRLLNKESLKRLNSTKHNLNVISREGSSHNIPLEEPEILVDLIKKWIN